MTDLDDRLRDYAQRWRSAQPAPRATLPDSARSWLEPPRAKYPNRVVALAFAAVAVVVVAGLVAFASVRHHRSTVISTVPPAAVPVAKPPLVRGGLHATGRIDLATGHSGSVDWTFFAQFGPPASKGTSSPLGVRSGLCQGVTTGQGTGWGCDDPTTMSSLTATVGTLDGDPATLLITGVTSAPASRFAITLGAVALSTPALANAALPGLRFYAIQVPRTDDPGPGVLNVEAIAADGTALLRNDPLRTPPPPPNLPTGPSPDGPHAIWPAPGTTAPRPASSADLARAFAIDVLGIAQPTVSATPTSPDGPTAAISILLPATGTELTGMAQLQADGAWAFMQLGDQSQLRGITYLPDGHPGPVMTLIPPPGATQADVTDVAADGTHLIHLTAAELDTKTLHLPTSAIVTSIIVVYRNTAGAPVGALASSF